MRRLLALLAACGQESGSRCNDRSVCLPDAAPFNPLDELRRVEVVQDGFQFLGGVLLRQNDLLVSDVPANTIYSLTLDDGATVYRMPSENSNGLALDGGVVIATEHGTHSITRNGGVMVSMFEGKAFNSPNDVIVTRQGTIYFTDPPDGLGTRTRELDFNGVFRFSAFGELTAEYRGALTERPNGIGISSDETRLYVTDSADGRLWVYPIGSTGALGERVELAVTAGDADGLTVDPNGNIYVATQAGIEAYAPDGLRWGVIPLPVQPSNCEFSWGGLYITAGNALYVAKH